MNPFRREQQKYKILIVEEDVKLVESYKEELRINHLTNFNEWSQYIAHSKEDALRFLNEGFDYAVLSDLEGDCFEIYNQIKLKDKFEDSRKIIVSEKEGILAICFDDDIYFKKKPCTLEEILELK